MPESSENGSRSTSRSTPDPVVSKNFGAALQRSGMRQSQLAQAMTDRGYPWRQQTVAKVKAAQRSLTIGEIRVLDELLETQLLRGTELEQSVDGFADRWAVARSRRLIADIREAADELEEIVDMMGKRGTSDAPEA